MKESTIISTNQDFSSSPRPIISHGGRAAGRGVGIVRMGRTRIRFFEFIGRRDHCFLFSLIDSGGFAECEPRGKQNHSRSITTHLFILIFCHSLIIPLLWLDVFSAEVGNAKKKKIVEHFSLAEGPLF